MAWDRAAKRDARNYADRAERVAFEIGYLEGWEARENPLKDTCTAFSEFRLMQAHWLGHYEGYTDWVKL